MDEEHTELDHILKRRAVPQMRSNLSERIIHAALQNEQQGCAHLPAFNFDFSAWMGSFSRNFIMPRPAMVMGLALVVGVVLGVFVQGTTAVQEEDMIFLYVENNTNIEGWL